MHTPAIALSALCFCDKVHFVLVEQSLASLALPMIAPTVSASFSAYAGSAKSLGAAQMLVNVARSSQDGSGNTPPQAVLLPSEVCQGMQRPDCMRIGPADWYPVLYQIVEIVARKGHPTLARFRGGQYHAR